MKYLVTFLVALTLVGCSSKSYFEPKVVAGTARYSGSVVTPIVDTARDGATLADGRVITKKSGLIESGRLPKGFRYVSENDSSIVASNIYGDLYIISKDDFSIKYKLKFDSQILSASLKGNLLALVDAKNNIMLYDLSQNKLIYKEKLHESVAVDTRLANPLFLNDIVVFPTLDGRLLVMSLTQKRVLRDIAISDNDIFNNVIFLGVNQNILVASTRAKVISVSPTNIRNYKVGVKDIIYDHNRVYVFTKDGKVILLTNTLKKINELDLPNAIFSAVFASDNKIYAVEKTGYLIEIEKDLSSYKVKKLSDEIKTPVIGFNNRVYIGDKYIILK